MMHLSSLILALPSVVSFVQIKHFDSTQFLKFRLALRDEESFRFPMMAQPISLSGPWRFLNFRFSETPFRPPPPPPTPHTATSTLLLCDTMASERTPRVRAAPARL